MSNLVASGLHDVRRAMLKLEVASKEAIVARNKRKLKMYAGKLEWIVKDFITDPTWSEPLRHALRSDMVNSDPLTAEDVQRKMDYLLEPNRLKVEELIDSLIAEQKKKAAELLKQYVK